MPKIGLFYGSKRGDTADAAEKIKKSFDSIEKDLVTVFNIKKVEVTKLEEYDKLILGSSTWEEGDLQLHWKRAFPQMDSLDLNGKQVAVFGLGNQSEFSTTFQTAIGTLARKARERGAALVGLWPAEDYDFLESPAVEGDHFLGLALDNTNQYELTEDRIDIWVQQIAREFGIIEEVEAAAS